MSRGKTNEQLHLGTGVGLSEEVQEFRASLMLPKLGREKQFSCGRFAFCHCSQYSRRGSRGGEGVVSKFARRS